MRLRARDRGLAVQVGVTILLGFIVIALATYQVEVVPQQNARVEFSHSQTVQGQLQDVRGAVVSVPGGGPGRSVAVDLGDQYPERTVFVNPPSPSGQLRTTSDSTLFIDNAVASGEVKDFWNGDERNVTTQALLYRPNYNVYQNGPTTVVENTVVFDEQPRSPDEEIVDSSQRLIDGNRITLIALRGELQEAGSRTVPVDVTPVSTSTRVVTVRNEDGSKITLTVPTQLSESKWEALLNDEPQVDGWTHDSSTDPSRLTITLKEGTYELRMAKVGLANDVGQPGRAYITDVEGEGAVVDEDTNRTLVVEVRDKFNNPVSGVSVDATTSGSNSMVTALEDSDSDGRVELEYQPPADIDGGNQDDQVNVSYAVSDTDTSSFDPNTPENAILNVTIDNADGSGVDDSDEGFGKVNPAEGVRLKDAVIFDGDNDDTNASVRITLENAGNDNRRITEVQYTFYNPTSTGTVASGIISRDAPRSVDVRGASLELRKGFGTLSPNVTIDNGTEERIDVKFFQGSNSTTDEFNVVQGDFFILTADFKNGKRVRYFVTPRDGTVESVDQTEFVNGSEDTIENGGGISFSIKNTGSNNVTVTRFSVATSDNASDVSLLGDDPDNSNTREVIIRGGGDRGFADRKSVVDYDTNGMEYPMDIPAVIEGRNTGNVSLKHFKEAVPERVVDISDLDRTTDENNADITVELVFSDGSMETIYFTADVQ